MTLPLGVYQNAIVTVDADGTVTKIANGRRGKKIVGGGTQVDVTASRSLGTVFQNLSGGTLLVQGWCTTSPGGAVASLDMFNGPTNPPLLNPWSDEKTATVSSAKVQFFFSIPNGYFYKLTASGAIGGLGAWFETVV